MEEKKQDIESKPSEGFYRNGLDELVKSNLAKLTEAYDALESNDARALYIDNLTEVTLWLQNRRYSFIERGKKTRIKEGAIHFDCERAREIREAARLSLADLAALSSKSKQHPLTRSLISAYETGQISPRPKNKQSKKYLLWLKDQGYNPYEI